MSSVRIGFPYHSLDRVHQRFEIALRFYTGFLSLHLFGHVQHNGLEHTQIGAISPFGH